MSKAIKRKQAYLEVRKMNEKLSQNEGVRTIYCLFPKRTQYSNRNGVQDFAKQHNLRR